jgi:hypothetical protein
VIEWRITLRHILPNTVAPLVVFASMLLGGSVLLTAGLNYIGLGAAPPSPEWGAMLNYGLNFLTYAWWMLVFPGLAIFFVSLSIRDGKLAALTTDDISGEAEIDVCGLVVAPGFIDLHTHPDGEFPAAQNLARLGVTTAVGGNCGSLFSISMEEFNRLILEAKGEIYVTT